MASATTVATPSAIAAHLTTLLTTAGEGDYIGELISQLAHSLQCAQLAATHAPGNAALIVAALLHDIGQFLPVSDVQSLALEVRNMRTQPTQQGDADAGGENEDSFGRVGHEAIGAAYLSRLGFPKRVCELVGAHVAAKRYLCAVEPGYYETLSEASRGSLRFQGGPMAEEERRQWEKDGVSVEMCRLRKWDDAAKIVGLEVAPVSAYEEMMVEVLSS